MPSPRTGIRLEWHALARRLFERHGIAAEIVDAADLSWNGRELRADELTIDMVYNRLVDFSLDEASHAALRAAYLAGAIVVTPNPRNHALFADKRNLTLLTDSDLLRRWGVPAERIATLAVLPRAVAVTQTNANALWAERKRLFFKPVAGHGGKAVYRGDKLTRAAWSEIRATDHIAQDLAAPSERHVMIGGAPQRRKMYIRLYTYEGELLLAAARLYQEQTTKTAQTALVLSFPLRTRTHYANPDDLRGLQEWKAALHGAGRFRRSLPRNQSASAPGAGLHPLWKHQAGPSPAQKRPDKDVGVQLVPIQCLRLADDDEVGRSRRTRGQGAHVAEHRLSRMHRKRTGRRHRAETSV